MKLSKIFSLTLIISLSLALTACWPSTPPAGSGPEETPSPSETVMDTAPAESAEPVSETSDQDLLLAAFSAKHPDWDMSLMDFTVKQNTGQFATGSVGPKGGGPGGGMFLAAKTASGWVIAWDGNGTIGCQDIEPYNFSTTMVPECYDDVNQKIVVR